MLRLAKYVKPFLPILLLAIVLLFIQAMSDLALPKYLSEIVDVGIQQAGVKNAVPLAIRHSEMDRLILFMNERAKNELLAQYTLVNQDSAGYEETLKEYPALADQPVYVLKQISQAEIDRLDPTVAKG